MKELLEIDLEKAKVPELSSLGNKMFKEVDRTLFDDITGDGLERTPKDIVKFGVDFEKAQNRLNAFLEEKSPSEINVYGYCPAKKDFIDINNEENIEIESFERKGGSYKDVKKTSNGETHEVHHMPANSASNLETDDGPCIKMEVDDHRQTASYGRSRDADEYRAKQKELIDEGRFREAQQMDIDDIHEKFGSKYDEAIDEMLEYDNQLEKEGRI